MSNYAAHYAEAAPVIRAWAKDPELDGIERPGKHGHTGVYRTVRSGEELLGLPWGLARDLGPLSGKDRTLYGYLNFVTPGFFALPARFEEGEEGGKVWMDEKPTPSYSDIEAFSLWADVDLRDKEPRFGAETTAVVEDAMKDVVEEFRAMCPHSVRLLDSGGGFYPHIHHKVTRGLALAFEGEERGFIFDALTDRFNSWLGGVERRLFEEVPEAEEVLKVDKLNHKNRVVKAPLAIHGSLDVIVHPVPLDNPDFDGEPYPMRPGLGEEALEWVRDRPTDEEAAGDLQSLIFELWPDTPGSTGRERLQNWLEEKREEEVRKKDRRRASAARREERKAQGIEPGDVEITAYVEDVIAAVEAIDVQEVARDYAAAWDTAEGRDPPRFSPSWRESETGTSCFVSSDTFGDVAEGGGGDAAKLVARATGIVSDCSFSLDGAEWWEAVDVLRSDGHAVPLWVPAAEGDGYDQAPLWGLRKAAVALGVLDETDFVERETETGETYQGFPDYETYHLTLYELEKLDFEHGREDLLTRLRKRQQQAVREYEELAGGST